MSVLLIFVGGSTTASLSAPGVPSALNSKLHSLVKRDMGLLTTGSLAQDLGYEQTAGDEVEDLFALLAFVKERLPGVEAAATGAIASDYQRLRVEHVRLVTDSKSQPDTPALARV